MVRMSPEIGRRDGTIMLIDAPRRRWQTAWLAVQRGDRQQRATRSTSWMECAVCGRCWPPYRRAYCRRSYRLRSESRSVRSAPTPIPVSPAHLPPRPLRPSCCCCCCLLVSSWRPHNDVTSAALRSDSDDDVSCLCKHHTADYCPVPVAYTTATPALYSRQG